MFHIFGVGFLGDTHVATGSVDKHVRLSSIIDPYARSVYTCHTERVKHIATIPRDANFLWWSASEDGTIRQFDKRAKHRCSPSDCNNVLISVVRPRALGLSDSSFYSSNRTNIQRLSRTNPENYSCRRIYSEIESARSHIRCQQLNAVAINPIQPEYIACAAGDPLVRVYDRRMLTLHLQNSSQNVRESCPSHVYFPDHLWGDPFEYGGEKTSNPSLLSTTHICWSPDGRALAATYSGEQVYLFPFNANQSIIHCQTPRRYSTPPLPLDVLSVTNLPHFASNGVLNRQTLGNLSQEAGDMVLAIHRIANERAYNYRYSEAIVYYTMALQLASSPTQRVHLLCNRAYSLIKRNFRGDALAAERDALEASYLDPSNYKPLFRRIQAAQKSRRKIKACRLARAAMKAFPNLEEVKTIYENTLKHVRKTYADLSSKESTSTPWKTSAVKSRRVPTESTEQVPTHNTSAQGATTFSVASTVAASSTVADTLWGISVSTTQASVLLPTASTIPSTNLQNGSQASTSSLLSGLEERADSSVETDSNSLAERRVGFPATASFSRASVSSEILVIPVTSSCEGSLFTSTIASLPFATASSSFDATSSPSLSAIAPQLPNTTPVSSLTAAPSLSLPCSSMASFSSPTLSPDAPCTASRLETSNTIPEIFSGLEEASESLTPSMKLSPSPDIEPSTSRWAGVAFPETAPPSLTATSTLPLAAATSTLPLADALLIHSLEEGFTPLPLTSQEVPMARVHDTVSTLPSTVANGIFFSSASVVNTAISSFTETQGTLIFSSLEDVSSSDAQMNSDATDDQGAHLGLGIILNILEGTGVVEGLSQSNSSSSRELQADNAASTFSSTREKRNSAAPRSTSSPPSNLENFSKETAETPVPPDDDSILDYMETKGIEFSSEAAFPFWLHPCVSVCYRYSIPGWIGWQPNSFLPGFSTGGMVGKKPDYQRHRVPSVETLCKVCRRHLSSGERRYDSPPPAPSRPFSSSAFGWNSTFLSEGEATSKAASRWPSHRKHMQRPSTSAGTLPLPRAFLPDSTFPEAPSTVRPSTVRPSTVRPSTVRPSTVRPSLLRTGDPPRPLPLAGIVPERPSPLSGGGLPASLSSEAIPLSQSGAHDENKGFLWLCSKRRKRSFPRTATNLPFSRIEAAEASLENLPRRSPPVPPSALSRQANATPPPPAAPNPAASSTHPVASPARFSEAAAPAASSASPWVPPEDCSPAILHAPAAPSAMSPLPDDALWGEPRRSWKPQTRRSHSSVSSIGSDEAGGHPDLSRQPRRRSAASSSSKDEEDTALRLMVWEEYSSHTDPYHEEDDEEEEDANDHHPDNDDNASNNDRMSFEDMTDDSEDDDEEDDELLWPFPDEFLRTFEMHDNVHWVPIGEHRRFTGHSNVFTDIKEVGFWGNDAVLSGSDDGSIFIWRRSDGELLNVLQGHKDHVNCVQPLMGGSLLATSGLENFIQIWKPTGTTMFQHDVSTDTIIKENQVRAGKGAHFFLRLGQRDNNPFTIYHPSNTDGTRPLFQCQIH